MQNCIIEKCTPSALMKTVAEHNKAFIVSPKAFEVLNKLLKWDEENVTSDVQIFCQHFSRESSSYRFELREPTIYCPIQWHPAMMKCLL